MNVFARSYLRVFLIGDGESLKNSIRTRYIARIVYELFATPDSVLLLEQYGLQLLNICEKRKILLKRIFAFTFVFL